MTGEYECVDEQLYLLMPRPEPPQQKFYAALGGFLAAFPAMRDGRPVFIVADRYEGRPRILMIDSDWSLIWRAFVAGTSAGAARRRSVKACWN